MRRAPQIILIVSFILFSWFGMQVVHELGHVLGAVMTGADVQHVHLQPLIISRTDVSNNTHPLTVVWLGPVIGVLLPLLTFLIVMMMKGPGLYLYRFFAGFCLVANGIYIAFGPAEGGADTGIMLQYGSSRWLMVLFGLICIAVGFVLWYGQGKYFGLGEANGKVEKKSVVVSLCLLTATVVIELIWSAMFKRGVGSDHCKYLNIRVNGDVLPVFSILECAFSNQNIGFKKLKRRFCSL